MKIETKYNYEKVWCETQEADLLKVLEEEIGKEGAAGTLEYIKSAIKDGKSISVGDCKFRLKGSADV